MRGWINSFCQSGIHKINCFKCFRVLIAYEKGLLVLWDVSEDRAISVRGYGDLHMKNQTTGAQRDAGEDEDNNISAEEEREICSLCWASQGGSTVAVGYITGDILLWDMTARSSKQDIRSDEPSNVVKLQLASGSRRLPVIVLHWSSRSADSNKGGHLFVYGGDDMGSEEVLTVCPLFRFPLFLLFFFSLLFYRHGCAQFIYPQVNSNVVYFWILCLLL